MGTEGAYGLNAFCQKERTRSLDYCITSIHLTSCT